MTNETYFQIEGEFLGVCALDGYKLKYLRLRSTDGDFLVKIPKELRGGMVYKLSIGDRIRCEGIQKDLKFKAYSIDLVDLSARLDGATASTPNRSKVKILICQSSDCLNNGGKEVYLALNEQLRSHNLNDSVTVQSTGCLKCCKQAPNLIVLPDRSSYHNVRLAQIPAVISKVRHHLSIEQN
jgi:(2Fe-2S) ferredoxin